MAEISHLELDLLVVFYTFADQFGNVDIPKVREFAEKRLNVFLPNKPFKLEQKHINVLMDKGKLPDTRALMLKIAQPTG